jgi:hypothetical protein
VPKDAATAAAKGYEGLAPLFQNETDCFALKQSALWSIWNTQSTSYGTAGRVEKLER